MPLASPRSLSPPLRVPVISAFQALTAAVRAKLSAATEGPAAELFQASQLELVDIPVPERPAGASAPLPLAQWSLTSDQCSALRDARILLGDVNTCAHFLVRPPPSSTPSATTSDQDPDQELLAQLEWMQGTYAGVETFSRLLSAHALPPPSFTLTRAGGIMPTAMAQYVLGWMLAHERQFFRTREFQLQRQWAKPQLRYRPFGDLTVGVLGFGDIGQGIAQLVTAAGFQVLGFKRRITGDERFPASSDLAQVLTQADFIVSALPSTPATHHLLTEDLLSRCCPTRQPVFINLGRGDVVAEDALLRALDEQWLSYAVLDVFETEPLPTESRLWSHDRVQVTPHLAAISFPQDVAAVFVRNLDRFLSQQPLEYPVDWETGY